MPDIRFFYLSLHPINNIVVAAPSSHSGDICAKKLES